MIITRAPFRVPLGGGGTDLPSYYTKYGGSLISVAIDKYMVVTVNRPVVDDLIRLKYSQSEKVESISEIKHDLIRESLKLTGIKKAIEISSIADIPAGTGMGSSGSYLIALLKALHEFKKEEISTQALAEEACKIEIETLKLPVGKQDQYMAAFGGVQQLVIDKQGRVEVINPGISQATLRELENSLVIFYTGIQRSSKSVLGEQSKSTDKGKKRVVNSLHFIKEIGDEVIKALKKGDINKFGALMDTHWQHKRNLTKNISSPDIDLWYKEARYAGAIGGKIMGAGGGGFMVFCCPGDKTGLRKTMDGFGLREMFFHFDFDGAKVIANI